MKGYDVNTQEARCMVFNGESWFSNYVDTLHDNNLHYSALSYRLHTTYKVK